MKRFFKQVIIVMLTVVFVFSQSYVQVLAIPSISDLNNNSFTEDDPPVIIDSDVSFSGGNDYSDGYLEFDITNSTSNDQLVLTSSVNPTDSGAISVEGSDVYLGNGTSKDRIGSVDSTQDGQDGQPLLIHFSSPLENYSFENGTTGWSLYDNEFNSSSTPYSRDLNGDSIPYDYTSQSGGTGIGTIELGKNVDVTFSTTTTTSEASHGSHSLKLHSDGWIEKSGGTGSDNPNGNLSLHGPYVASTNTFHAYDGDSISLDWKAVGGGDNYEVFGYLVKGGTYTKLFSQRGDEMSSWETENVDITSEGDYRFLFIGGTYDRTGGYLVGADLYVDNIRLISGTTVNDSVVSSIAQQITYENTSNDPNTTTRNLTVSAEAIDATTGSADAEITLTAVNDAPNAPTSPQVEGQSNPTDVADFTPEFSWTFSDPESGDSQSAYQIIVGTTSGSSDMWDSGKISDSSSSDISYNGATLAEGTTYYWKVKTWDNHDAEGPYCSEQTFTMENVLPSIDSTSKNVEVTTGESVTLWATASDNIDVTSAKISIDGSASEAMTWDAGDHRWKYVYNAPLNNVSNHTYKITVSDEAGNTKTSASYDITISDNDAPTIDSITGDTTGTTGETTTISVTFSDNIEVTSATLYYKTASAGSYSSKSILDGSAGIDIPFDSAESWYYYVTVNDAAGNGPVGDPSTDGTSYYTISVSDNDKPSITNTSGDVTVTVDHSITLWAEATDNIDVTGAEVSIDGGSPEAMTWNAEDGRWEYTYNAPSDDASDHEYGITVSDEAGNTSSTTEAKIITVDKNTARGNDVVIEFEKQKYQCSDLKGIILTYDRVTATGITEVEKVDQLPFQQPSGINMLSCFYEVKTTAEFEGNVNLEISYDDSGLTLNQEENLKEFKLTGDGGYEGITESSSPEDNQVTGRTDSLAFFGLGYGTGTIPSANIVNHGPNPVPSEGCIFWFDLPSDAQSALLRVYDVDGRPLVEAEIDPNQARYPTVGRWEPRDANGNKLGSGLYMYRLKVERGGSVTWSDIHKLVVDR